MDKKCRRVRQVVLKENDLAWLLNLCRFPVEVLDAIMGVIYRGVFTVVGGCNLSINAPSSWISEKTSEEIRVLAIPHCGESWDYHQISPYSNVCFLPRTGEIFLNRWKELLTQWWKLEGDEEYVPFSMAFLHNHPILRPEYIPQDLRADFEAAHDLSNSKLSFADWLKRGGQAHGLSVEDLKFIRKHTTDNIGLLVRGAEYCDLTKTESIAPFVTGWQIGADGRPQMVRGSLLRDDYLVMDKEYAYFLQIVSEKVCTMANQAKEETSFYPTLAARSNEFLHTNTAVCSVG